MTTRVPLAVGLFAGFYLVGVGLALALLWLPWAQMRYDGTLGRSGIVAGIGALYVLWALVPPRVRWVDPGPEIPARAFPRLHALVADIAGKAQHPVPRTLYLIAGPTAFASSRSRWCGLRREPIVAIGLPLFAFLTDKELAAVVGHEFGHHVGGDVKLGSWQYRTHRAIAAALHRLDGGNAFLHLPFYLYGRLFLRVSGAASREQELRADALAARIVSARALGGALIAVEQYDAAWNAYWHTVYAPAIDAGFLLPMLEGYRRFLAELPATLPSPTPPDEEDTHPPLDVRLAALGEKLAPRRAGEHCEHFLADRAAAERLVLTPLLTNESVLGRLNRISWDEWGERVLPLVWKARMGPRMETLAAVGLETLPSLLTDNSGWWERLRMGVNIYSPEAQRRQLRAWLGHWVALRLVDAGFRVASGPGAEPALERDGLRVEPFRSVEALSSGTSSADEWRALAERIRA